MTPNNPSEWPRIVDEKLLRGIAGKIESEFSLHTGVIRGGLYKSWRLKSESGTFSYLIQIVIMAYEDNISVKVSVKGYNFKDAIKDIVDLVDEKPAVVEREYRGRLKYSMIKKRYRNIIKSAEYKIPMSDPKLNERVRNVVYAIVKELNDIKKNQNVRKKLPIRETVSKLQKRKEPHKGPIKRFFKSLYKRK